MNKIFYNIKDLRKEILEPNGFVGLCHGCFDLLHPGHLYHLEKAKSMCDILIVSVTPDKFINKGPGRPLFNENIRAWQLAQLNFVDYVVINNDETACDVINLITPDFYFKGSEYKDKDDITGKIKLEKDCVEKYGGELKFTDEPTFSSTKLINDNVRIFNEEQKIFVENFKSKYTINDIQKYFDEIKKLKILVIGDPIIDIYNYVKVENIANKSPNISTRYEYNKEMDGGSIAISNHISNFVSSVFNVSSSLFEYPVVKERFLASNFKNVKLFEFCRYPDNINLDKHKKKIKDNIDKYDLVVISDFGHGFIDDEIYDMCLKSKKFIALNVQTNSGNLGFNFITKYKFFNFATVDEKELRLPFSDKKSDIDSLINKLKLLTSCNKLIVTLGYDGLKYFDFDKNEMSKCPNFENNTIDTLGAGDAVFSIASLLTFVNAPSDIISFVSNCAGAIDTKIVGNENYITYSNIYKYMDGMLT